MSVIDDVTPDPAKIRKVLLTSGKLYWELVAERTKREADDVAIVRIEQYYPLPKKKLLAALERYTNASQVVWVQEEPENQGAWPFFGLNLPRNSRSSSRTWKSSPAARWRRRRRVRRRCTRWSRRR